MYVLRPYFWTYTFAEPFHHAETLDLDRSFRSVKALHFLAKVRTHTKLSLSELAWQNLSEKVKSTSVLFLTLLTLNTKPTVITKQSKLSTKML